MKEAVLRQICRAVADGEIPGSILRDWCKDNDEIFAVEPVLAGVYMHSHTLVQQLYEAGRDLLAGGPKAIEKLRGVIGQWDQMRKKRDNLQHVIEEARNTYETEGDTELSIDDACIVYHNDEDGYWVEAWVFIHDDESEEGE